MRSGNLLLLTAVIEGLLPLSFVVQSHVSPHACGTQMAGTFTMTDSLQAETADHSGAVGSRYVKTTAGPYSVARLC